jgi:hypothetical protein
METTLGCAAAPSCVTEKTGDVILLGAAKLLHEDSPGGNIGRAEIHRGSVEVAHTRGRDESRPCRRFGLGHIERAALLLGGLPITLGVGGGGLPPYTAVLNGFDPTGQNTCRTRTDVVGVGERRILSFSAQSSCL